MLDTGLCRMRPDTNRRRTGTAGVALPTSQRSGQPSVPGWRALFIACTLVSSVLVSVHPLAARAAGRAAGDHWVASWVASPTDAITPFDAALMPVPEHMDDQTVRMIVTPHLGGTTLRVHLSNRFGSTDTTVGAITVGLAQADGVTDITPVTFGGASGVTVAPGADAVSDPVQLAFSAFQALAVTAYLPGSQGPPTKHWNANATSFYSSPSSGNLAETASNAPFSLKTEAWFYVDDIDVEAPLATTTVVAFGDSITDGFVAANPFSLPVSLAVADKNGRYPDDLQRLADASNLPVSIVDAGIAANQLLTSGEPLFLGPSGLQRFQRDALDVPGVKDVILLEGINDLGVPGTTATPSQLIAGYEQAIMMAHGAGVKIWLGTITPASNAIFDGTLLSPNSETYRETVNAWIRSQHLSDGIVDFDAALRDPSDPAIPNPAYAGPDNLHPNLLGYQVMAQTAYTAVFSKPMNPRRRFEICPERLARTGQRQTQRCRTSVE